MAEDLQEINEEIRQLKARIAIAEDELGVVPRSAEDRQFLSTMRQELVLLRREKERLVVDASAAAVPLSQPHTAARTSAPSQEESPYIRRWYVLFNFQQPAGLLENGIREFLISKFTGRRIGGTVYRANLHNEGYGQCVIVRACGEEEELFAMENEVLNMKDINEEYYWEYTTDYKRDERANAFVSQSFQIMQSMRGAICGEHSDPRYDNRSEIRSVSSHTSSKK